MQNNANNKNKKNKNIFITWLCVGVCGGVGALYVPMAAPGWPGCM